MNVLIHPWIQFVNYKVAQKLPAGISIVLLVVPRNVINPRPVDQNNLIWNHKRNNSPFNPGVCFS